MISYPPSGSGRTMRGLATPICRMLSTVSVIASSSSTLKGCPSKGCSSERGIRWTVSATAGASASFFFALGICVHLAFSMWVYGKKKKGVYPAPSVGQDTRLCNRLRTQKKSGYRPPDFSDSDTRSMKPCFIVPVGVLPSLRRPALFFACFGSKNRTNRTKPAFYRAFCV